MAMLRKILVSVTTVGLGANSWQEKIEEIEKLDLDEVAFSSPD